MTEEETTDKILSTGQAARLCSVTRDTVLKWIKLGKIEAVQTAGGHYRIKRESLKLYISVDNGVPRVAEREPQSEEKGVSYCWEYHSESGLVQRDCRKCIVFQSQAQKCFLMAGLGEKGGHAGIHCKENCYECEYFHFVSGGKIKVLVVTENEGLKQAVRAGVSDKVTLEFASCEYDASAVVHDFRPDFVIVDDSLGSCRPEDICRHMLKDPRVRGAQIILAVPESGRREELLDGVCASISMPFTAREMEESFHRLRKSLWGGGRLQ